MKINRTGCTRIVILTKNYALKIPNFLDGYRLFLTGLLANDQEAKLSKLNYHGKYCPVLFSLWGGFLNVMPKCKILTNEEFLKYIDKEWTYIYNNLEQTETDTYDGLIPVELKSNSFGWLNGKIVAVDYGS